MDNTKNDDYYIEQVIQFIDYAIENLQDKTLDELDDDRNVLMATLFCFIQMSELIDKVSDDFKITFYNTYKELKGMRNRIVHNYNTVNTYIIFDTVKNDLPSLKKNLIDYKNR